MNEVIIEFDDDLVFTADQWPIDIEGTVWKLDELPTFQRYKHGTFYQHVKKLKSSIADINYETGGNLLQECKQLIRE